MDAFPPESETPMRLPMTAAQQLERARDLGHELEVVTRVREDFPDAPPKFFCRCSCGWQAKAAARSAKGANFYLIRHLGQVIAEGTDDSRNGGTRAAG